MSLRFGAWVEEFYHNRPHSSLDGKSPLEVYRSSIKNIRTETYEAITEAFKHSAERKVDHTGCFSFEGQTFRCGVDHAGKRVLLRYDPSDLSSVEVFYKKGWHCNSHKGLCARRQRQADIWARFRKLRQADGGAATAEPRAQAWRNILLRLGGG